jgi:hypothetical protein
MLRPRLGMSLGMIVSVALGAGCETTLPAATPHKALGTLVVLLKSPAEVTWTDRDCAVGADAWRSKALQDARKSLSRAGFRVVTDPSFPHDTTASVVVSLLYCNSYAARGSATINLEPGTGASDHVGFGDPCTGPPWQHPPPDGTCFDQIAQRLAESSEVIALAANPANRAKDSSTAAVAAASALAATASPSPPEAAPPSFTASTPQLSAYALVIGIERYRDAPAATGARADAERFAQMAHQTLGIPDDHIKVALDDRATKSDVEGHIAWLKTTVQSGGRAYFYYSGHGAPDATNGTPYLLPYDGNPKTVGATAIPLAQAIKALSESRAKEVIAFVDSCFSGAGGRSVLPPGARPLVRVREVQPAAQVALLTASAGDEISGPAPGENLGLFTKYLTEAVGRGAADADGDGQVSLQELLDYVKPRVSREAKKDNREQTPQLIKGSGFADSRHVSVAWGFPTK